jgi:hypothetical protein
MATGATEEEGKAEDDGTTEDDGTIVDEDGLTDDEAGLTEDEDGTTDDDFNDDVFELWALLDDELLFTPQPANPALNSMVTRAMGNIILFLFILMNSFLS